MASQNGPSQSNGTEDGAPGDGAGAEAGDDAAQQAQEDEDPKVKLHKKRQ